MTTTAFARTAVFPLNWKSIAGASNTRIEAYVGSSGLGGPHRGIRDPGPEESMQVGRDVGMWYFGWETNEKQSCGTSEADTGGLMLSPPFLQLSFICLG